ncbi:S8 family peptidase [Sodalinema gerasimenkoae]|uniref:S8 family peptidase n=1 Tax=Sodalinema gerasimenkoae TaxID=2862348 RepID=UPI00135820EA|nr:S8 family peptidase [Sodalinema gerasimenkoae]
MKNFLLTCLFFLGLGWALATFSGLANQGTYESLILNFRDDLSSAEVSQQLEEMSQQFNLTPRLNSEFSQRDHIYIVEGDREVLQDLRRQFRPYLQFAEPNYIYGVPEKPIQSSFDGSAIPGLSKSYPNDPLYSKQWNLKAINVEGAWADSTGEDIIVAVIDTGILKVADLEGTEFVEGYDFVNDQVTADDDNGHGTHVAGTISQTTDNEFGVAGIAYQAKLMPLKVLSKQGGGTVSDIAEAIRFAADHDADVINLSLGGSGESHLMRDAIDYAYNKGVVIIAAAGNANQNSAGYPARYPRVLGVAASNAAGDKAPYSNFGAGVDISAPGGDTRNGETGGILQHTLNPQDGSAVFAAFQGTSMASPHVAAVAALVKATGVESPDEVMTILKESARAVEEDSFNHFGAGHLDAASAVQLAVKGQLNFRDFFRWLRDNGYLNPRFWIDGGTIALIPKLAMVIGSYLLAWLLRNYFPFRWNWNLATGLVMGSSGVFILRSFYVFDLPQWPLRLAGSSLPELGTAVQGNPALNPIFASVLIPGVLLVLLLGHAQRKWWAIGATLGVASCLAVSAVVDPELVWLGSGWLARGFLAANAIACWMLARLAAKPGGITA